MFVVGQDMGTDHDGLCCDELRLYLANPGCLVHPDGCPDVVVRRLSDGSFGLPVADGGDSVIAIRFCPWCGERLG